MPSQSRELTITKFAQTIESYMKIGGLQIQSNIIDRATLEDAKKNPSEHPDLVVRVSGYTAYFNCQIQTYKSAYMIFFWAYTRKRAYTRKEDICSA